MPGGKLQRASQVGGDPLGTGNVVDIAARDELAPGVRRVGQQERVGAGGRERVEAVAVLEVVAGKGGGRGPQVPQVHVAVGARNGLLVLIVEESEDVARILVQVAEAEPDVAEFRLAAGFLGSVEADRERAALERLSGDEVDDAADRIGAVQRGGAVSQHLHPLDRGERDAVQIGRGAVEGVVGDAAAVEQDQRLVGADPADVGERRAGRGRADHLARALLLLHDRDALDDLLDRGDAFLLQVVDAEDRDRHGGLGVDPLDRRAGDLDAIELLLRARQGRERASSQCQKHGLAKPGVCHLNAPKVIER